MKTITINRDMKKKTCKHQWGKRVKKIKRFDWIYKKPFAWKGEGKDKKDTPAHFIICKKCGEIDIRIKNKLKKSVTFDGWGCEQITYEKETQKTSR